MSVQATRFASCKTRLNIVRLGFAATAIVAMTYQFASLNVATGYAKGNFFSFFTIQSNILAVAALCLLVIVRREERTPLFDRVRSGVVLYMAITGVVFAVLLAGLQEELQTTIPWVDFVVHKLMPVVLVADWLLDPPRHRLPRWIAAAWLCYPACMAHVHARTRGDRRLVPVPIRGCEPARLRRRPRAQRLPARRDDRRRRRVRLDRQPPGQAVQRGGRRLKAA